jgi:endoglucanase
MKNRIYTNQIGYRKNGSKTAVLTGETDEFSLIDSINHETVFTGYAATSRKIESWGERVTVLDFSPCDLCGLFYLRARGGSVRSEDFYIAESPYDTLLSQMAGMFFANRCGTDTRRPGNSFGHPACHVDPLRYYHGNLQTVMNVKTDAALQTVKNATDTPLSKYAVDVDGKTSSKVSAGIEDSVSNKHAVKIAGSWTSHSVIKANNTTDGIADVSGGFHDGSEYTKSVYQHSVSLAELIYAVLIRNHRRTHEPQIDITDSIIDEIKHGLLWILKMEDRDGGVYGGVRTDAEIDIISPEADQNTYSILPKNPNSTVAFAAVCALAYWLFRTIDPAFAKTLSKAAVRAWVWYADNHASVTLYAGLRFWAVCELYALTGTGDFLEDARRCLPESVSSLTLFDTSGLGMLSIFSHPGYGDLDLRRSVLFALRVNADNLTTQSDETVITRDDFPRCSNIYLMSDAIALATAGAVLKSADYTRVARRNFDYILGANPLGKCFVTGFGTDPVRHPHNTLAASRPDSAPLPGMVVFGATADRLSDSYLKWQLPKGTPPAKCYGDAPSSRYANSASMASSALLYLLASAM